MTNKKYSKEMANPKGLCLLTSTPLPPGTRRPNRGVFYVVDVGALTEYFKPNKQLPYVPACLPPTMPTATPPPTQVNVLPASCLNCGFSHLKLKTQNYNQQLLPQLFLRISQISPLLSMSPVTSPDKATLTLQLPSPVNS